MSDIDTNLNNTEEQPATKNVRLKCDIEGESLPLAPAGNPSSATPSPRGSAPKTPECHTDSILLTQNQRKFNCIDLFCGCGGLSEGFRLAGFNIIGGIDFNEAAIKTFNHNFKNAKGLCCDLSTMDKETIVKEFGDLSDIDVIIGGPPCQGFSCANRYQKEIDDPRNKLFFEFVKFVDLAQPKAVVIENVRGIVTRSNGYAKQRITEIFEERGFQVVNKILDASEYGVPQRRLRNFFVITKKGIFDFESIKKSEHTVTVQEAIGELYQFEKDNAKEKILTEKPKTDYQKYLRRNDNKVPNDEIRYPAEKVQERISYVKQGQNWKSVPAELWPTNRNNRHSSAYKRLVENDERNIQERQSQQAQAEQQLRQAEMQIGKR